MIIVISILIFLASILLIGVVLIQKSKGGGLAASASNYNQFMGVRKTTDFVEKATWGLAIFICVLSIATPFISKPTIITSAKKITLEDMKAGQDQKAPQFPTQQAAPAAADAKQAAAPAKEAAAPAKEAAAPAKEAPAKK
jgi:preprotein translocase subunit SecG